MKTFLVRFALALLVATHVGAAGLADGFRQPPAEARPWVYWYFMDGNMSREGITADLEAMRDAGIGGAIFLEVDLGLPRGPVKFMSPEWQKLVAHAVHEAERLGIAIALGAGPGWCGTGGPWVTPDQSMQHLVASETHVKGPANFDAVLARPPPRTPFFGEGTLTPELRKEWLEYYRDVAVLAFPRPRQDRRLADIDAKALYYRAPYSSMPGVHSALASPAAAADWPADDVIPQASVIDLSPRMAADGRLKWEVPPGEWTILRFVRTATGQITRPAPEPGLGFESDKFSAAAVDSHLDHFVGQLLQAIGPRGQGPGGLKAIHFDSWEMGSQNWSENFPEEFRRRRGYDLLRYLPAFTGRVVGQAGLTERFLWDVRQTAQELVIENHATRLRSLANANGLSFSVEPYDMNPTADLSLGGVADVPMGEFWWLGYDSTFSVIEAAALAHTNGKNIVAAESFTSDAGEDWRAYPANMKALGDWALASGVNRVTFHRLQHQPALDRWPGMQMGPFGVHWDRTQTWWPMASAYHSYLSRSQYLLRQGESVADILFLAAEGAPHVFSPPRSATEGNPPDRRGYNFDASAPDTLIAKATVVDGRIAFPGGSSYQILVLPQSKTMTPALLRKIKELVQAGATVVGAPPEMSPSLSNYPRADAEVQALASELWGGDPKSGRPQVLWNSALAESVMVEPPSVHPLAGINWIWTAEESTGVIAPAGTRSFERTIDLPVDADVKAAEAYLTADNRFSLTVNGRAAGGGSESAFLYKIDLSKLLRPGANRVVVSAENTGETPSPAGVIGKFRVVLGNGKVLQWQTDASWTASARLGEPGTPARELGPLGTGPWMNPLQHDFVHDASTSYAGYGALAKLLGSTGLPPDFESNGPVRYTHRRTKDEEIYFVANRSEAPVQATGLFRVSGRQPELWDPVSGNRRPLHVTTGPDGRAAIALRFAPLESYFVVFPRQSTASAESPVDFPDFQPLQVLTGSWEVSFGSSWSEPARVRFSKLTDWTLRPEPGIKYYSGVATYRKTFQQGAAGKVPSDARIFLDLGAVKNMARVRLNGKDLGVVWTAPWRVEVTGTLRPGANELEIEVANLWVNRLVGDAALPPEQRRTWTSHNPYEAGSALQESGLLGPVVLARAVR